MASFFCFAGEPVGRRVGFIHLPAILRLLALVLLGIALARPQLLHTVAIAESRGRSAVLLIDVSASMLAEDLQPNRLAAAKHIADRILSARPDDRFGLMTFAADAVSECPLTVDHRALAERLRAVSYRPAEEGTALGEAIGYAIEQVKRPGVEETAVILITDGVSNRGALAPLDAARAGAAFHVRIYAVGLGSNAPAPYGTEFGTIPVALPLDETTLEAVASTSGGVYVPAATPHAANAIARHLEDLRGPRPVLKSRVEITDLLPACALAGLLVLLVERALGCTALRTLP